MRAYRCVGLLVFFISISFFFVAAARQLPTAPDPSISVSDSLYNAHHPRLLFNSQEIPALQARRQDGGKDDMAYDFIKLFVDFIYPSSSNDELLYGDFGLHTIPNLGLATFLESPKDTLAEAMGRNLTLYIADYWDVDNDIYYSSLRLRALALGYDLFFQNANAADRDRVLNEILSYMNYMIANTNYEIFQLRPYLGNKSAMFAAAIGLAAICLDGETTPSLTQSAIQTSDSIIELWLAYMVDERGTYNEGILYGSWSLQHLIYYFHARKKYDGLDYADEPKLRNMEKWFAYELLTEGNGRSNNLNDSSYSDYPLPSNTTYFDWALSAWASSLSSWLWDHIAGTYGYDNGIFSDKAGTVLWHQEIPPQQPGSILPGSFLWRDRGLYYYRTGWPSGSSSNDVMFSFYSGKYQGGHAQEDQNQFTLYAYGEKFAIDNGIGTTAKQTEAHNLVLIDSTGQHNAGSGIGTDGNVSSYLLSSYADYVQGDATSAYSTYSPLNEYDFPRWGTDWSWGYDGGNPVNFARRTSIVVHDPQHPPYFIIMDDIEKDGFPHLFEWRMHTYYANAIDTTGDPVRISKGTSFLDVYALNPQFPSLSKKIAPFNNLNAEPNTNILSLGITSVNPRFTFLLVPGGAATAVPLVNEQSFPWGTACTLNWGPGTYDVFLANFSGGEIIYSFQDAAASVVPFVGRSGEAVSIPVMTDASTALLRIENGLLKSYLLSGMTICTYNDTVFASIADGPANAALSGGIIKIDRYDADFSFYAPQVDSVFYRNQRIYVANNSGYITPDPVTGLDEASLPLSVFIVSAYPNPFNPSTTIIIEPAAHVNLRASVFDIQGRAVKTIWDGLMEPGPHPVNWDGTNNRGAEVASGVYFLRVKSAGYTKTIKLTFIK